MKRKAHKKKIGETKAAESAIRKIAEREGVSVDSVRKHIQLAMLNGLCSNDPQIKAFWDRVPRTSTVPTPEELITYLSKSIVRRD